MIQGSDLGEHGIHPGRLTWNLRIHPFKTRIIFQTFSFRFHVNLPGCIWNVWNHLGGILKTKPMVKVKIRLVLVLIGFWFEGHWGHQFPLSVLDLLERPSWVRYGVHVLKIQANIPLNILVHKYIHIFKTSNFPTVQRFLLWPLFREIWQLDFLAQKNVAMTKLTERFQWRHFWSNASNQ